MSGVDLYGPGGPGGVSRDQIWEFIAALQRAVEAGVADGSVTDIKVAAGAAIQQSKIAGLIVALAAKALATDLDALATATSAALAGKAPATGIAETAVTGLVADLASKATPAQIATAIAALSVTYVPIASKGVASGVASLDGTGKVPSGQLPAATGGTAAATTFTPTGGIAATDVQAALAELDSEKATPAQIATAIANLLASAPSTLDTLNELAAALGNDPNFATTITTLIGTKQPLDSDLTAIAALTTTTYGRAFLALADAAAARTALGAGAASGLATLGADGILTNAQRPTTLSAQINAFSRTRYYVSQQNQTNVLGAVYRTRHKAQTAGYGAVVRFGNIGGTTSLGEGSIGNTITIKAAIEDSAGLITPLFFNGSRTVTLNPDGGVADSDPVGIEWSAETVYYVRTMVTVPVTTNSWPQSSLLLRPHLGEGIVVGTTVANPTDVVDSGTITVATNQTTYAYGPLAILSSRPVANPVILALYADSIGTGQGDQTGSAGGPGDLGCVQRALYRANAPILDTARGGEQANSFATPQYRRHRFRLTQGATAAITELGVNDITGGATLAQMQARVLALGTAVRLRDCTLRPTTITPHTTSTDQCITTANQTVTPSSAAELVRTGYNDWLRAGAPIDPTTLAAVAIGTGGALVAGSALHPLAGYLEAADAVESSRNSGKWIPYMSYDCLHPSTLGHKALAAAIDTTVFGFSAQPAVPAFPTFSGLKFRYNFGAITGLADSTVITSVADLGPNGWTLTPSGAGGDPTYRRDFFNGYSGVSFTGGKILRNTSVAVAQPDTIVAVFMMSTFAGTPEPFDGITTRQRYYVGTGGTGGGSDIYAGTICGTIPLTYNPSLEPAAVTCVFNGASSLAQFNGVTVKSGNAGANALGGLQVGTTMTGAMIELFAWDHDVTAVPAEIAALNAYLAYAYDLNITGQPQVH